MKVFFWLLFLALVVLHQDFWWRYDDHTLVFGFLPVSLAYQIGISIAGSVFWGMVSYRFWPAEVELPDFGTIPTHHSDRH